MNQFLLKDSTPPRASLGSSVQRAAHVEEISAPLVQEPSVQPFYLAQPHLWLHRAVDSCGQLSTKKKENPGWWLVFFLERNKLAVGGMEGGGGLLFCVASTFFFCWKRFLPASSHLSPPFSNRGPASWIKALLA